MSVKFSHLEWQGNKYCEMNVKKKKEIIHQTSKRSKKPKYKTLSITEIQ